MNDRLLTSSGDKYRALVIGASGGIGQAVVAALKGDDGYSDVIPLSRSLDGFDLLDEAVIEKNADKFRGETFNLILCATGALTIDGVGPEKSMRQLSPEVMARQFALNAIGPALVLKHFSTLLPKSERSVFAFLSARVGSIGDNRLGGWVSYRASKAALNQIIRTASTEIARSRPLAVVVAIHPGTVATTLSGPYSSGHAVKEPDEAARDILTTLDRLTPAENGQFFAYDGRPVEW